MNNDNNVTSIDFNKIAAEMKESRIEEGWTQEQVADELGIDQKYYQRIEAKGVVPGTRLFLRIIMLFHISLDSHLYTNEVNPGSSRRLRVNSMLDRLTDRELTIIEGSIKGIFRYKNGE